MEGILRVDAKIKDVHQMDEVGYDSASAILSDLVAATVSLDGFIVANASAVALYALWELEMSLNVYFAMSRHLVESMGFAALHGLYHDCKTYGAARHLVQTLVMGHRLLLSWVDVARVDQRANMIHQGGVGVLVNDLPDIPFLEEYAIFTQHDETSLVKCLQL
mmetsp:Transcript_18559/g.31048  ORF Transcript_18559/g.31048 Transcript_18559/m.31048 type:complete len:163 (+) Transcript_18559:434-922(+)